MMPPLVVLHGANGSAATMKPLVDELAKHAPVAVPDLLGHGGRPVPAGLTMDKLADDLLAWLDECGLARVYLCGYSIGGTLALYVARRNPERVAGLCTIAAKYVIDDQTVGRWMYLSEVQRLEKLPDNRPAQLAKRHEPQDWRAVLAMNRASWLQMLRNPPLTPAAITGIRAPALVISAEADQVVPAAETRALAGLLGTAARLYPGIAHPLEALPLAEIAGAIVSAAAATDGPPA